jgi:hypothetical protein
VSSPDRIIPATPVGEKEEGSNISGTGIIARVFFHSYTLVSLTSKVNIIYQNINILILQSGKLKISKMYK